MTKPKRPEPTFEQFVCVHRWRIAEPDGRPVLPARCPFHELPNVLMTPHISGWTDGTLEARATLIAENIDRTARREPHKNVVP